MLQPNETQHAWAREILQKLDKKLSRTAERSYDKLPYTTVGGVHDDKKETDVFWWTNGFWGGLLWLMYVATGKPFYMQAARHAETLLDPCFSDKARLNHDTGFMWQLTAGIDFRLTGDERAEKRNLEAADVLAARFVPEGNYIRAWNGDDCRTWSIIDCMMNLSQLYRASEETGDPRYRDIAVRHADMTLAQHLRPDGSVRHIVVHDETTGAFRGVLGGQGYDAHSCWSRGAGWALYGFAVSYVHTRDPRYLDAAKRVAHYVVSNLALHDWLPPTDFRAPSEPVRYDATAGAIAAAGLLEIARNVPALEQPLYVDAAVRTLRALEAVWCDWSDTEDSILQMGMERYSDCVNRPIIYGDFFFADAVLKLLTDFFAW